MSFRRLEGLASLDIPLFKIILTSGGMESTPVLIASKAISSGTGFGVHLCMQCAQ